MLVKQYEHRLPADYDMGIIRRRAAKGGPAFDATPGLRFKAFMGRERGSFGAVTNCYSSLYLWNAEAAALDFLTGERFRFVTDSFGRPVIHTWLPLGLQRGAAEQAKSVIIEQADIDAQADLAAFRDQTERRDRELAAGRGTYAVLSALDLATWRHARFTLSGADPQPKPGAAVYEVFYFASPDMPPPAG